MSLENQQVRITDIAFGGDGVARLANGAIVFVPLAAVGDLLEIEILQESKNLCRGRIVTILEPGAGRCSEAAPCPHYGRCGGCAYQHLTYEAELAAKKKQFEDAMRRLGHFDAFPELEIFQGMEEGTRYGYRNKLRLEPFRKINENGGKEMHYGFCERDNKTFFPVKRCLLAQEPLNEAIPATVSKKNPLAIHNGRQRQPSPATLRVDSTGRIASYFSYASPKMSWLKEDLLGQQVSVPVGSFWQVNPQMATKLLTRVREWLDPLHLRSLVDAYSGIGTFSLALGNLFQYRVVIESDANAVACAEFNHKQLGLEVHAIAKTTESALADVLARVRKNECCVVLDPPRTGCLPKALKTLLEFPVHTLLYVSCNVSTLARDLRLLAGTYEPVKAACFDMFPCTSHFESAVLLTHRGGDTP